MTKYFFFFFEIGDVKFVYFINDVFMKCKMPLTEPDYLAELKHKILICTKFILSIGYNKH